MHVRKNRLHQASSSAYNQTVQWAIKEDEDKAEDLWRSLYCLYKQRQEINQSVLSSQWAACWWQKSHSLLWLLAMSGRFRPDLYQETSGCSDVVRTQTRKLKLRVKKIDNFLIKEKQTHYFDEKQLVCCQLGAEFTLLVKFATGSDVFFFFFVHEFRKKLGSCQTDFLVHSVTEKDITLAKVSTCKTTCKQEKKSQRMIAGKSTWQMEWKIWDLIALFKGSGLCYIQFF